MFFFKAHRGLGTSALLVVMLHGSSNADTKVVQFSFSGTPQPGAFPLVVRVVPCGGPCENPTQTDRFSF
jgi:hypothetical protein